jgi:hypothetical protein
LLCCSATKGENAEKAGKIPGSLLRRNNYLTDLIIPFSIVTLAKNSRPLPVICGRFAPVSIPFSRYCGPNIEVSMYRSG